MLLKCKNYLCNIHIWMRLHLPILKSWFIRKKKDMPLWHMNKKDTYKTKQEKASNLKHVCKYDYLLSSTPSRKARGHNGESATRWSRYLW